MKKILLLLLFFTNMSFAQELNFLIGFGPAGGHYIVTNIISNQATQQNISNKMFFKEGAGGIIGMNECVSLKSNNTLCMATQAQYAHSILIDSNIRKFDPEKLKYVIAVGESPTVLVTKKSNDKSLQEVINHIKNTKVNFANGALGLRILTSYFLKQIGPKDAVMADYKGTGEIFKDINGGVIDYAIMPYTVAKNLFLQNQIRIVATFGESEQITKLGIPKIQTVFPMINDNSTIFGFVMAPEVSDEEVKKYEKIIAELIKSPAVVHKFEEEGIFPLKKQRHVKSFAEIATEERKKVADYIK